MRAARLLQILLLLQNRGRQTSGALAAELEVTPRTILRDVDAMTEAGLPIIVHQGNRGGIELGFNYRTRLTGLAQDEAEAMGLILSTANPIIAAIGLDHAATRAKAKLIESFPDKVRHRVTEAMAHFSVTSDPPDDDPRVLALARAIKAQTIVRLRFTSATEQIVHPTALHLEGKSWRFRDDITGAWIDQSMWGRMNVSAKRYQSVTTIGPR